MLARGACTRPGESAMVVEGGELERADLAGHVVSSAGSAEDGRGDDWLEQVVALVGARVAPMGAETTWVVTHARPGAKKIAALRAKRPELIESTIESFMDTVLSPATVLAALRTDEGRDWLRQVRKLLHRRVRLDGAQVSGVLAHLSAKAERADFRQIQGAGDCYLQVTDSTFENADLTGANGWLDLERCDLRGAKLVDVDLRNDGFKNCDLRDATIRGRLGNFNFSGCDLRGVHLDADLTEVTIVDCDFRGATFGPAVRWPRRHIQGSRFDGLDLGATGAPSFTKRCSFVVAKLRFTTQGELVEADCTDADFAGSDLMGFDLRSNGLTGACFEEASLVGCLLKLEVRDLAHVQADFGRGLLNPGTRMSFGLEGRDVAVEAVLYVRESYNRHFALSWKRRDGTDRWMRLAHRDEGIAAVKAFGLQPLWDRCVAFDGTNPRPSANEQARDLWSRLLDLPIEQRTSHANRRAPDGDAFGPVERNPDDRDAWAVLADYLAENGDPRGRLIADQLAAPDDAARKGLAAYQVEAEREALLGRFAAMDRIEFVFHWCFVSRVRIDSKSPGGALVELAAHPSTRLLRRVVASSTTGKTAGLKALVELSTVREVEIQGVAEPLVNALSPCPHVRKLLLRRPGRRPLAEVFPGVEELSVEEATEVDVRGLAPTVLSLHTRYDLDLADLDRSRLTRLAVGSLRRNEDLLELPNLVELFIMRVEQHEQPVLDELEARGVEVAKPHARTR